MSIYLSRGILLYCGALACVLGAVFGSFLNCAAWRIAHGESFLRGHSHCPTCGHELGARDLVPVLSWAFQRGRCRYCGEKISVRYPLTELAFALLTLLCLLRFDLTALCLRNWVFLCCLFCLSLVDLESYTIPDGCLLTALGAWLAALPFLRPGLWDIGRALLAGLLPWWGSIWALRAAFSRCSFPACWGFSSPLRRTGAASGESPSPSARPSPLPRRRCCSGARGLSTGISAFWRKYPKYGNKEVW